MGKYQAKNRERLNTYPLFDLLQVAVTFPELASRGVCRFPHSTARTNDFEEDEQKLLTIQNRARVAYDLQYVCP